MSLRRPSFLVAGAVFSVALFLVACGGGSKSSSSGSAGTVNTGTSGGSSSGAAPEVTITAKEYSFDMPDTLSPGLTKIKFVNAGKQEHTAQFVRLNSGATPAQMTAALQDQEHPADIFKVVTATGGVNAIAGGKTGEAYINMTPGSYFVLSFGSADENSPPDFAQGMLKPFTVKTGDAPKVAPPKTAGKVTLADYNFLGVDTLPAGATTIEVLNGGRKHEIYAVKLKNGFTADQLKAELANQANGGAPPPGQPPFDDAGGIGALAVNTTGYLTLDLAPGNYAFLCFIPDVNKNVPHAYLGMVKGITVK